MIIRTGEDGFIHARSSEITPRDVYLQRRESQIEDLKDKGIGLQNND